MGVRTLAAAAQLGGLGRLQLWVAITDWGSPLSCIPESIANWIHCKIRCNFIAN